MKNLYSIYDTLSEKFGAPVALDNDAMAGRSFRQMVHPEGRETYQLYRIGTFDEVKGEVTSFEARKVEV